MTRGWWLCALLAASALGALFSVYLVVHAYGVNGRHGFPIDDAWIHLTYARNLVEHGTFAYFPGDATTSGSTSPLYTFLIAAALAVFGPSKVTSFAVGIAFHTGFLALVGLWARRQTNSPWLALVVVLMLGASRHLAFLSVSGMETSLFLLLVALVFYAYTAGRPLLLGNALGLAIWARTDALVLVTVILIAAALARLRRRRPRVSEGLPEQPAGRRAFWLAVVPAGGLGVAYLVFNKVIGGAYLPTTFAGKTTYYANRPTEKFLHEVAQCFAADGWLILLPFALVGLGLVAVQIVRRRAAPLSPEVGLVAAWLLAYLVMLPYAGRVQRYLVPALPAFVVLAVSVIGWLSGCLAWRGGSRAGAVRAVAAGAVLLIAAVFHLRGTQMVGTAFARACQYHATRHERVGHWLANNTPVDAVIATHDIGAIAYYSRRRVIDLVGLVRPDVIEHLHTPGYTRYLESLLNRTGVTFVATLRNWLEVDNEGPLFVADPEPELLEVYAWRASRHHLVDPHTTQMRDQARRLLARGDVPQALAMLRQLTLDDPRSARSWAVLGRAADRAARFEEAADAYRRAMRLNPDNRRTRTRLAATLRRLGRLEAAEKIEAKSGRR